MPPTLWLSRATVSYLEAQAQKFAPHETGGVLVGWINETRNEVVVARAIGAGPGASHHRYRFSPDGEFHDTQVARLFNASGGLVTYIGDWHTHPGGTPRLSRTDIRTMRKIAHNSDAACPAPTMLVVAGGPDWVIDARMLRRRRARRLTIRLWAGT